MRKAIAFAAFVVLLGGGYLTVRHESEAIPRRLQRDALSALSAANIGGVEVTMSGRDAVLHGSVQTTALRGRAIERVQAMPGIRDVDYSDLKVQAPDRGPVDGTVAAPAGAIDLSAEWREGELVLRGEIVGAQFEERLDQKVAQAFVGALVAKKLTVLRGDADEELVKRVAAGLEALSKTSSGILRVTSDEVTLSGAATDEAAQSAISEVLRGQIAPPVKLAIAVSVPPPVVDGGAPEADAALSAGDAAATGPEEVDAATAAADTEPAADTAPAVSADAAEPVDTAPEATADAGGAAAAPVGGAPHAVDLGATTPLEPQVCQDAIMWVYAEERRIQFTDDRATELTPESDAVVQQVASLLKRCPGPTVTVEGFTGNIGEPDELRALSVRRARKVRERLAELGVDDKRMTVRGYGYNRPRYPNTSETRHLNDRVEVKVSGAVVPSKGSK